MALRDRHPLPQAIQNAPELELRLYLYFDAYLELDSCRQVGWNVGPIPWTAIKQYCLHMGVEEEQEEAMFHHVRQMDIAYLTHLEKKRKK